MSDLWSMKVKTLQGEEKDLGEHRVIRVEPGDGRGSGAAAAGSGAGRGAGGGSGTGEPGQRRSCSTKTWMLPMKKASMRRTILRSVARPCVPAGRLIVTGGHSANTNPSSRHMSALTESRADPSR